MDGQVKSPRKKRKVSIPTVIALLVLLVFVLFNRDRLADMAKLQGIIDADAPDPVVIRTVVGRSHNPARALRRLWDSGKIPHRWETISFLNKHGRDLPNLLSDAGEIIDQAAFDRDLAVRFIGMNLARIVDRPVWLDAARTTLNDPDYDIRREALQVLRRGAATNALADIAGRLSDENKEIASLAAGMIRNFTGLPFPGTNLIAEVTDWWSTNRNTYPPLARPVPIPIGPGTSFAHLLLEDNRRKPLPLNQFSGKPILISFFATWSAPTMLQMPDLKRLQAELGDRIKIIGVPIDTLGGARKHHGQVFDPEAARKHVLRVTAMRRLNYDIAFDPDGIVMLQLEGAEVPSHILLDRELRLIRRFTGHRNAKSLIRIITELTLSPKPNDKGQNPR